MFNKETILAFLLLTLPSGLQGFEDNQPYNTLNNKHLSYEQAFILGLVEGVTEFIPVSSTGHLILTNEILGLNGEGFLLDNAGQAILVQGKPYPIKEAIDAYCIIIQAGALFAVFILFWKKIISIIKGFLGKDPGGSRLGRNLIIALMPAIIAGLTLHDWIENKLFETHIVIYALVIGGIIMIAVEQWRKKKKRIRKQLGIKRVQKEIESLTWKESLMIGLLQCLSMIPGTSRSMTTIIGGYFAGLSPKRAAEFSFLLGLITLSAASGYKALTEGQEMIQALDTGPLLVGCMVAFISGGFAVRWVMGYLQHHGIAVFGWYRLILAIFLLWTIY